MRPHFETLSQESSFYFVRHGESKANKSGRIQGRRESPLSETGRRHARAAGEWMADKGMRAIFTSPLARCTQTAEIIADAAGLPRITEEPDLIELATGIFSGLSFPEIQERYPAEFQRFQVESWEAVPDAEPVSSLLERAVAVWNRLIETGRENGTPIASVTHVGFLQWLIKATVGVPGQQWVPVFRCANCGIYRFDVRPAWYDGAGTEAGPADGYFGEWKLLNFVPYGD